MPRRLLCLYFSCLAIDRLQREEPALHSIPFAVTQEDKGHLRIAAVNSLASLAGIRTGVRLADAQALLPNLKMFPDDSEANARVKQRLMEWCKRYSPLVADDGFGGIVLDITGCAHLFNGEAALLSDIEGRIRRTGYRVRGAIADTLGGAWALARYGKQSIVSGEELFDALHPLPINALRLPEETIHKLRCMGLTTIGLVRGIARRSLTTRYGPLLLLRLNQAFHDVEEPIAPHHSFAPYRFGRTLAEPIGTVGAVQHVLLDLLQETCSRLQKECAGARRLILDCCRVNGTVARCSISTSKPVRSVTRLMRLFSEKLGTIDAGFGIETLVLSVPERENFDSVQLSLAKFDEEAEGETALAEFIDRLGMRLGFEQVCRLKIRESFLPESAIQFQPITDPSTPDAVWPQNRIRPIRLIVPPMHIEVSTMLPGGSPVQFLLGRQVHRIMRAEGPERLTAEWWSTAPQPWGMRDYYRVEDQQGNRLWIFREMQCAYPPYGPARWFLHGHLP